MRYDEYGCNVASIVGRVNGRRRKVGQVFLYDDGTATVYDDLWGNAERYCNSHSEAMRVIVTRIIEECELVW